MDERWLITGASGQLGGHVLYELSAGPDAPDIHALAGQSATVDGPFRFHRVDLAADAALRDCVRSVRPTHILHLGAMTAVGDCFARPADAERVNVAATQTLADEAERCGARLIYCSTDMVFGGDFAPYRATDRVAPLSIYGRTKAAAELLLVERKRALVARIPLMYGVPRTTRHTTFVQQLAALRNGKPLKLFTDEHRTPIWLVDAARALISLALSDCVGVMHVAGPERLSRYELVVRVARQLGVESPQLIGISRDSLPGAEPRPADLSLIGEEFVRLFPQLAPRPIGRETTFD